MWKHSYHTLALERERNSCCVCLDRLPNYLPIHVMEEKKFHNVNHIWFTSCSCEHALVMLMNVETQYTQRCERWANETTLCTHSMLRWPRFFSISPARHLSPFLFQRFCFLVLHVMHLSLYVGTHSHRVVLFKRQFWLDNTIHNWLSCITYIFYANSSKFCLDFIWYLKMDNDSKSCEQVKAKFIEICTPFINQIR